MTEGISLLAAGFVLGADRVEAQRGHVALAREDEDAVTLAVEAAAPILRETPRPTALIFASTTAPYDEGGSSQPLAEMLGLQGALFTAELSATERDGLAALRLALALAAVGPGPVLVCAAHAEPASRASGDGAVALLLGRGEGLATVKHVGSHVEELRDAWRLHGRSKTQLADRSFVAAIGTTALVEGAWSDSLHGGKDSAPAVVTAPDARSADRVEKALSGTGDRLRPHVGQLGAAHPLLRMLASLDGPSTVIAAASGFVDRLDLTPTAAGAAVAADVRAQVEGRGDLVERSAGVAPSDLHPYSSPPRAWRERGVDLRLEGILDGAQLTPLAPSPAVGTVVAWTRDRVYPATEPTEMVIVDFDAGGRFYGQVAMGETVSIGDRVRLVPRWLHTAGDVVQYFWKAAPCL